MKWRLFATRLPVGVKILVAFFAVLLLMVWEHTEAHRLQRRVASLREEVDRQAYENGRLQLQIHQWVNPSHLELLAREQYKMAPPDAKRVIGLERR